MKVLFISGEFPPMQGGVGDYTRELGLALRDLGCQVQVVTAVGGGPVPGLTVFPLIRRWHWGCWAPITELIRQQRPAVVHIQYQAAAYAMHPAINLLPRWLHRLGAARPRAVVTFHDLRVPYLFPKAGWVRRWVVQELGRRCDAAITTNCQDHQALSRALPTPPALIPIGSSIAPELPPDYDRDAWRARWGAGPGDLLLCFFGFVNDRKGVDTLIRALSLLVSLCRTGTGQAGTSLLMIGGQTGDSDPTNVAYLGQIQALIEALGLTERVRWTGFLPPREVSACLASADLCVLPFRDGASFQHSTFHTALVHGVPILTTRPPMPLPELVDGQNVRLVAPEDPAALAQAILELAGDAPMRQTLGAGARELSGLFRWERIAAQTISLYRAIGAA